MTRKQCFIAGQCFIATVRETQNSTIHKRHAALVGLATFQKKPVDFRCFHWCDYFIKTQILFVPFYTRSNKPLKQL